MTQRFSQNGWPAYATTEHFTRFTAAGQGWWAANADVAVLFTEFIDRFVREVEPIAGKVLDDWSYANRLVRGSTSVVSNHGSATAIDLNALKHPRGVHNTFSPTEQRTMHRIRDSITDDAGRPVLRLGMDFTSTVDDMHVEVDANAARVKQAADKIRKREVQDMAVTPLSDADVVKVAKQVWALSQPLGGDPPQTPGGLLLTISKRVSEANLEARAKEGVEPLVEALRADLTEIRDQGESTNEQLGNLAVKVDQILAALAPPQ